ncbi:transporter substrate-binding domain-containing protein [Marinobacter mangrovi]|uniref:transporter substrate-binding domain-containing protein n=1 Tax=Marinobacter mangrovi TaxID=2803918 RepID=UPI0019330CEA|nr:transporter substrate-binding domain-containing protein [Marinobacter mangrovi]
MKFCAPYILLLGCLAATSALATQPLQIYAPEAAPYQYEMAGEVHGTTVEALRCALNETSWRPEVHIVPQRRGIHSLRTGVIDGYMAITPSDDIDQFATLSAPLALEKWYLYSREPVSLSKARLGAIAGSNESIWLHKKGLTPRMQVSSLGQLVALIERDRIDAMVVDQRVMERYLKDARDNRSAPRVQLQRQFIRFAPLGLYVGKNFLAAHPRFLARFNDNLDDCVSSGFQLEDSERQLIQRQSTTLLDQAISELAIQDTLSNPPPPSTLADILMIDELWQASTADAPSEEAQHVLERPLSKALRQWQEQQHGRVTETMVMDAQGSLVASSQMTSDYWQGDEDKFRVVAADPGDGFYIGPVRYDASAQHFQVIASRALHDPRSGELIGAVALGIDIEKALSGQVLADVTSP